jgi:hypothetical protein
VEMRMGLPSTKTIDEVKVDFLRHVTEEHTQHWKQHLFALMQFLTRALGPAVLCGPWTKPCCRALRERFTPPLGLTSNDCQQTESPPTPPTPPPKTTTLFVLDESLDRQVYRGVGSSELPVRKLVLLDISEIKRKSLRSQDKTLHFCFHQIPSIAINILSGLDLWR